jgi:hypothetical protein
MAVTMTITVLDDGTIAVLGPKHPSGKRAAVAVWLAPSLRPVMASLLRGAHDKAVAATADGPPPDAPELKVEDLWGEPC